MPHGLVKNPIYQQLNQALRRMILDGEYTAGDKFLTERQVSTRFEVSRATANKAIASLVAEGLLEFRKGIGTFVRANVLDYDMEALVSFTDKARSAGKKPSTQVLHFAEVPAAEASPEAVEHLGLKPDEPVYIFRRLRLADGKPVILEERTLVSKYCPACTAQDVDGSLYTLLTERFKLDVEGADQTIRAVPITGASATHLDVPDGTAGLLVLSTGYLAEHKPLWWEETLYRGDAYEFRNRIGRIQTARPATGALIDLA